jgi:hypothetical protein
VPITVRVPLALSGALATAALQLWLVESFAQTPTPAPIEAAVLHIEKGRMVALPVLSFPVDPRQIPDQSQGGFDARLEVRGSKEAPSCPGKSAEEVQQCSIPPSVVAQHHYMRATPGQWLDSTGAKYRMRTGWYFVTGGGDGIGFDLGPAPSSIESVRRLTGRALLSDAGGFPVTAPIRPAVWKRWPELARELTTWLEGHTVKCGQSASCREAAKQLATAGSVQGDAWEFKLQDGRALQYLRATSQSKGKGVLSHSDLKEEQVDPDPDRLQINLWRIVTGEGAVRVLRLNEVSTGWLSGAELVDPYCDSQCTGGWTGRPDVFTAHGRTFMFGPYQGGTTGGYLFFEVMPTELKRLGWYRWGS